MLHVHPCCLHFPTLLKHVLITGVRGYFCTSPINTRKYMAGKGKLLSEKGRECYNLSDFRSLVKCICNLTGTGAFFLCDIIKMYGI